MVHQKDIVRGEFCNEGPVCESHGATYRASLQNIMRNDGLVSKELKEQHNRQGLLSYKSDRFEDGPQFSTNSCTFQERERENFKSSIDYKTQENLRHVQSLVKEKQHSTDTVADMKQNTDAYDNSEKSDQSKEITQEENDIPVLEKMDKTKDEFETEHNCGTPTSCTESRLDFENEKFARFKIQMLDEKREVKVKNEVKVKQNIEIKELHMKNEGEIMDNKLVEEMEKRSSECPEETSPKKELYTQQTDCQQKEDLPEKDDNQEIDPEFRSLDEGEWLQSVQENSCDSFCISVPDSSVVVGDLPENSFEIKEVEFSTEVIEEEAKTKIRHAFENHELLTKITSALKLLQDELSKQSLNCICKGSELGELQQIPKNVNLEGILAMIFMKLFLNFEPTLQPEKCEWEDSMSEKGDKIDVESETDFCDNEIEPAVSEKLDNEERVINEGDNNNTTEKGEIEANEKFLTNDGDFSESQLVCTETACEKAIEGNNKGYGREMVEDFGLIPVVYKSGEADESCKDQDVADEIKDAHKDFKTEIAELEPEIKEQINETESADNIMFVSDGKSSKLYEFCVKAVGPGNKIEEDIKKMEGKIRCIIQSSCPKPSCVDMMNFEQKRKEMTQDLKGLVRESRDWAKRCTRCCVKTCRKQGQMNNRKPNRYEPRSESKDCDIFKPKTMKDRRHLWLLQYGQIGRRCSDSGSNSAGSCNTGQGEQRGSNRREKENEDHNNNHSHENGRNDRGNPNDGNDPGSNKLPGTSQQDTRVPQQDFKAYRKKHSDISDEHWEKFLGFIKEIAESRGIPLWDLHPNPVAPCLALCMKFVDDLPEDMLECIVCLSINSLLKHYANCSSAYMNCNLCTQIFSLIACHINECVQRAETFGNEDRLHISLHVKLCQIPLCKKIRQALNNNEISQHLKMLWFHVRKRLSRVIGGIELETEEIPNRRPSVFGIPSSLESIPEDEVPTVQPTSRPTSRILSRKRSNLTNVAETTEPPENTTIYSRSGDVHGEVDLISSDAVPETRQQLPKETGRYSSLPIGPPKVNDQQFPSFTDRPSGIHGLGEVVYGNKSQLKIVAKSWDKRKNDYQEEGKLPTHYREEGVILDRYMNNLTIQGTRYQKDFQWVRVSALGNGMSGKCSLATDFETDAKFCVKEIHIASYEMEEIILWTELDHPYIVQLYGAIRFGERVFIFMEYIAGGCLTEAINHQRELGQRLSQATALRYFRQILEVLVQLKAKHILHEDLKGDNILLHQEGTNVSIKVTDFGAARRCEDKVRKGTKPIGTQTQWSPEKAEATGYSYPAELWAAVCVLVHMLSGTPPWIRRFESFKTLIVVIVDHSPPLEDVPRNISESVRDLIERGFTVCPGTRPTPEEMLRHSAFAILDNRPTSEAYSILAPGFQSVPCIEDDLTKDLREIYKQLGATSPDKKTFPFLQPSSLVQVFTVGESTEQSANQVYSVGGARSIQGGATGQQANNFHSLGGTVSLGGGAIGQEGGAHRRYGRVEDEGMQNYMIQSANGHRSGGTLNTETRALDPREPDAENRHGIGKYMSGATARNISIPSDPSQNLDPTQHFNNFLNDTTPPGVQPPETTDHVIEYNPGLVDTGIDQEANTSNESSLRISSDEIMKKFVPNFDLLLDPEEKSDNYREDVDSQGEEEDMFKDFDLKEALIKMNLSSDKLGEEMADAEGNENQIDDNDEGNDKKKLSEATVEPEPIKPVVHSEQETYPSFDDDDLFKSGSPTSAGYLEFNVNPQIRPQSQPSAGYLNPVQGLEHHQQARFPGHHGEGRQGYQYDTPQQQQQLLRLGDQQYRNTNPQFNQQHWDNQIYINTSNTNFGLRDQISPRHSTANPYSQSAHLVSNMRADPLSLSPIQNTGNPHPPVDQRYPHSLSPSQLQESQQRHFDRGYDYKQNQTVYQRRQMSAQQWVDHRRVQPNSNVNNPQHYGMTGQIDSSQIDVIYHQSNKEPNQSLRFDQQTDDRILYQGLQPHDMSRYIPVERIITEPPGQSGTRHSNLQLDVEKAQHEGSQPPSTYAQTAPVESPPKTSPTYKRARSYIPPMHQQNLPAPMSTSSTSQTSKSQLEEQERAFLELQHTARKELSQHEGSIPDFQEEDDIGVEGEIDVTGNLTSQEWESMALYLQEDEKDSRIEVTFKKRGDEENVMKMKFTRKNRTATWEKIIDDDLSRVFNELSSEYQRFCLRHEDGTLLDINSQLGDDDVVLFIEPAEDGDWWCVEKGMIMKS